MSGRPASGYRLADGTRVPGTTTVAKLIDGGDIEGLLIWANRLGQEGKSHRAERDAAASIGTLAHDMVEAHIRGESHTDAMPDGTPEDAQKKAFQAFDAYVAWERRTRLVVVATEVTLVSERHRFGGTLDAIGEVDDELCLLDWKTSNSIYPAYLLQLAAYRALWEEHNPTRLLTGGFHLCRFSKDFPDFSHHHFASLEDEWEAFLHCLAIYEARKTIKRRAA